jgi:hypothetical protein
MNYFACLMAYLVGGAFVALFVWVVARSLYLRWWGMATTGNIVAFEIDTTSEGLDMYTPVVAFTTHEGLGVEAKSMYGTPTAHTDFRVGQTVALRYAARKPTCFAIEGYEASVVLTTFLIALMGVAVMWAFS